MWARDFKQRVKVIQEGLRVACFVAVAAFLGFEEALNVHCSALLVVPA
jgi:hypothetical protein